jgi:hypothetical protein
VHPFFANQLFFVSVLVLTCDAREAVATMNCWGMRRMEWRSLDDTHGAVTMIHYTCDCCKRSINPERELRYVVRVEVYAAIDNVDVDDEDERDHLQEIQDILERLDDADDAEVSDDVYHQARYDMCSECRARYVKNPLGRAVMQELGFSQN